MVVLDLICLPHRAGVEEIPTLTSLHGRPFFSCGSAEMANWGADVPVRPVKDMPLFSATKIYRPMLLYSLLDNRFR